MNYLISIIIPVYKTEQYIDQCISSILSQTYKYIEVLLVDDGSPDRCPLLCDEYEKKDRRVKVIHKKNGGLSSARNVGVCQASGDYILFVDSDDYWEGCDNLQIIVNAIKNREDVVVFRYKKYEEISGRVVETIESIVDCGYTSQELCIESLVASGIFCASACNKMIRRELLLDNEFFFREGVTSEDIEWSCRVLLKSRSIGYADVCPYVYRQREDSITTSMQKASIEQLKENIILGIQQCEECSAVSAERVRTAKAYMAYQYTTILFAAHNVRNEDMYPVIHSMKKYRSILEYSRNRRIVFVRRMMKLVGFKGLYVLTGVYWKIRYK